MVEKDAVSKDFRKQALGYGLTQQRRSFIAVRIVTGCCKPTSGRTTICFQISRR